jgi:hypothetical protein
MSFTLGGGGFLQRTAYQAVPHFLIEHRDEGRSFTVIQAHGSIAKVCSSCQDHVRLYRTTSS